MWGNPFKAGCTNGWSPGQRKNRIVTKIIDILSSVLQGTGGCTVVCLHCSPAAPRGTRCQTWEGGSEAVLRVPMPLLSISPHCSDQLHHLFYKFPSWKSLSFPTVHLLRVLWSQTSGCDSTEGGHSFPALHALIQEHEEAQGAHVALIGATQ